MKPLISLSDLLNHSWILYKKNWKPLVKILFWGLLIIPIIAAAFALFIIDQRFWPTFILAWLVAIAIQIWVQVKFIQSSLAVVDGKPLSPEITKDAWSKVPALFGWSLLWGLAFMAAMIPLGIPFVWLMVLWSNADLRLIEGKKPYARGSSELINGRWWATFGRHLIPFLIMSGLLSAVQLISFVIIAIFTGIGFGISAATGGGEEAGAFWIIFGSALGYLLMFGAQLIISFGFAPFQSIYRIKLYRSLEETMEKQPSLESTKTTS